MNDNVDANPPLTQPEKRMGRLSKRSFLKISLLGGVSLAATACVPESLLTPAPPTSKPDTPTSTPKLTPTEQPASPTKEVLIPQEEKVIVNYERQTQQLYLRQDASGNRIVASCDVPQAAPAENGGGFVYNKQEFDWSKLQLPEVSVGGSRLPLLTSRTDCDQGTIEFLENWYRDPQFVEKQIRKLNLPPPSPNSEYKSSIFVHYRSTRNHYWEEGQQDFQQGKQDCQIVSNNNPKYDPLELYNKLATKLSEATDGAVTYVTEAAEVVSEDDTPLTEDPNLTYPDLLTAYKRSINYQKMAELAVKSGATTAFVFTGPSAGMYESTLWTDRTSGKQIQIFGLNYDLPYEYALHSWAHFLENQIKESPMWNIYMRCVGRDEEYGILPYLSESQNRANFLNMNNGRVYASIGLGTVHLAPNSVSQYEYDSPLPIMLPGQDQSVNATLWGGDGLGYYSWWLKSLPRSFLSAVR